MANHCPGALQVNERCPLTACRGVVGRSMPVRALTLVTSAPAWPLRAAMLAIAMPETSAMRTPGSPRNSPLRPLCQWSASADLAADLVAASATQAHSVRIIEYGRADLDQG